MSIAKVIEKALECVDAPPPNESATCEWVILPILYVLGYDRREVVARDADSAAKFPDYTLLPALPKHTFYLEAKAWKVNLNNRHANQALNYANQNGKRWVVLTSGREWRLYDNDIRGLPKDKMVATTCIENQKQAIRFMEAIGKASVCSNLLPQFAAEEADRRKQAMKAERRRQILAERQSRLSSVLQAELTNESSSLVAAMLAHLRSREGLTEISAEDLITHFTGATVEPRKKKTAPSRPDVSAPEKVLVIPARDAWQDYLKVSAYMCQPNRSFQPTARIAFYVRGYVETLVPRIMQTVASVQLSESGIASHKDLSEVIRTRLVGLVQNLRAANDRRHLNKERQVMFLSGPKHHETIAIAHRIENDSVTKTGRPWAFVVRQRYVRLARLLAAPETTSQLLED